ncbi:MAG: hypothetical protein AAGC55_03135 [Myxococcota bacterium]
MAALAVAAGLLTAGCSDDDDNPSTLINESRILAVSADPPVPTLSGTTALRALLVDPPGTETSPAWQVSWRVCDPWQIIGDPTVDCPADQALALQSPDTDTDPGDDGPVAELVLSEVLEAYPPPSWFDPASLDDDGDSDGDSAAAACDYGFVELTVVVEAIRSGERLLAIKRLRVTGSDLERRNPVIADLALHGDGDGDSALVGYSGDQTYQLDIAPAREQLDLTCPEDGDADGADEPVLESLRVFLYSDGGRFDEPFIDIEYEADGEEIADITTWTAPPIGSGAIRLWTVVVDGDGGVGWSEFTITE